MELGVKLVQSRANRVSAFQT